MVNLRSLLLSLAFTLLPTLTLAQSEPSTPTVNTTNPTIDPCTTLGSRNGTNITYTDVSDCYKFIPFNRAQANTTLTTLYTLYNDFYVFRDASRNPIQLPPFSNESVDILGELDRIRGLGYANDFQFHADVRAAVGSLRDVHASYEVNCYTAYSFVQPLYLYAPVINITQYVRVYKDNLNRNMQLEDCIVTTIDNVDALTYLRQAADELVHYSHDPNVRLNAVLTSQLYRTITGDIIEAPGEFSRSRYLPKAAFVDYQLKCANSESPLMLRDEWIVEKLTNADFDDRESYVENSLADSTFATYKAEPRFSSQTLAYFFSPQDILTHTSTTTPYSYCSPSKASSDCICQAPVPRRALTFTFALT
ncbi:hypothetical protein BGZ91_001276 [Linnemannia elongata]|nr:hypothetical protein BGZ91_001276 [Linnemannia elongata]